MATSRPPRGRVPAAVGVAGVLAIVALVASSDAGQDEQLRAYTLKSTRGKMDA